MVGKSAERGAEGALTGEKVHFSRFMRNDNSSGCDPRREGEGQDRAGGLPRRYREIAVTRV